MCNSNKLPDLPKENRILFDWVSFTTCKHSLYEVIELAGLSDLSFELLKGSHGFRWRLYFNGISLHFNEKLDASEEDKLSKSEISENDILNSFNFASYMEQKKKELSEKDFVWLEMSGQGCRAFESYGKGNYDELFSLARHDPDNIHITRLDVAFDDFTGVLNIDEICGLTHLEHFVARSKNYQAIYSNSGNSALFGSRQSNVLVRIYDKAKERGYVDPTLHWVRCELQLKDVNAMGFANKLLLMDLREVYQGVLKNYLSFRIPSDDSNKRRWKEQPWWTSFLNGAVPISVWSKPGVEYNLSACERYVMTQPIGSIQTLIDIHGIKAFYEMIKEAPPAKNPKYRQLIAAEEAKARLCSIQTKCENLAALPEVEQQLILHELRDTLHEASITGKAKKQKA